MVNSQPPVKPQETTAPSRGLAQLCARLEAAPEGQRADLLSLVEDWSPSTEAEWRLLDRLFRKRGSRAWMEIMVDRFLESQPDNLAAQLARMELMTQSGLKEFATERRKQEAIAYAGMVAEHPALDEAGRVRVGEALLAAFDRQGAVTMFRQILRNNAANVAAWRGLVIALSGLRQYRGQAPGELRKMRRTVALTPANIAVMAECAHRLKETGLFQELCTEVLRPQHPVDSAALVRMMRWADQSDDTAFINAALGRIDVGTIHAHGLLETLGQIAESRGHADIKQAIDARMAALRH